MLVSVFILLKPPPVNLKESAAELLLLWPGPVPRPSVVGLVTSVDSLFELPYVYTLVIRMGEAFASVFILYRCLVKRDPPLPPVFDSSLDTWSRSKESLFLCLFGLGVLYPLPESSLDGGEAAVESNSLIWYSPGPAYSIY